MLCLVFHYPQDAPAGPTVPQKLPFRPSGVSSLPLGPVWGGNLFLQRLRLRLQWEVEAGGGPRSRAQSHPDVYLSLQILAP